MLRQTVEAVLPRSESRTALGVIGKWAVLLFPLALVSGFLLLVHTAPTPPLRATLDRPGALRIARTFAVLAGIPAGDWSGTVKNQTQPQLLKFINAKPERLPLWTVAPPLYAGVTLTAPHGNQSAYVDIGLDGKVIGFAWKNAPVTGARLSDAAAQALASAQLPKQFTFGAPSVEKKENTRVYTFSSSSIPDVELKLAASIEGNRVTAWKAWADADKAAMNVVDNKLLSLLALLGFIFISVVAVFSIYRYASRSMQQEISHRRSLSVAGLCACFCLLIAENAAVVNNDAGGPINFFLVLAIFGVLGLVGGALLAAVYGSGEGDVREAYPGKLTSLDALLTGRVFSHNLGVSVLFGMAVAGWLLLIYAMAVAPIREVRVQGTESMSWHLVRWGWVMSFVTYPLVALSLTAVGLLQPLAFLHRYAPRIRRWHVPLLVLTAAFSTTLRSHSGSNFEFFAFTGALVAALLAPFFACDLLATIVCVAAFTAAVGLEMSVAMAPGRAVSLGSFGAMFLGVTVFGVVCVRRGKRYTEEQVRPVYARNIEERKSLEAEVSAAREAQLRLLPQTIPDFAGIVIAASCVPAETVGGDFYDFFRLGDGRLGIFLAEGNNRGLAAALTIALAKGYLMHCVGKCWEPTEILVRLEVAIGSIFEGADSALTDFAFASIDIERGELRYARTGAYPKVVLASKSGVRATERLVPVRGRTKPIAEGVAALAAGDHVLLFTDGIGRRLAAGGAPAEDVATALATRTAGSGTADVVRDRFLGTGKESTDPDDLTVVVVRVHAVGAAAVAGVAEVA